jgi:anti-sigma regulatory factor (Ser/Thr protein kinase)
MPEPSEREDGAERDMEHDPPLFQHDFEVVAGPGAAASARDAVASLGVLQLQQRLDVVLVAVSELVSNAVLHGQLQHDVDVIRVTVRIGEESVGVRVEQPTTAEGVGVAEPRLRTTEDRPGGFGLLLVDQLVDKWGHDPGPPGRVWFEFDKPSS